MKAAKTACPNCSEQLSLPPNYEVLDVHCPACKHVFLWRNPRFRQIKARKKFSAAEGVGAVSGVIGGGANYEENVIFGAARGFGFAAERANHWADVLQGKDAKLVGGDNLKNGPDRVVNGVNIQSKYCSTGSTCVGNAFENGAYRYYNADGTPMALEVPSDKYDAAVQAMQERIKKGQVAGVTDPEMAKEIVRKGHFTYEQARNIARFGTVESLTYDAINGVKIAGTAFGMSAALTFVVQMWRGAPFDVALKNSCYAGFKVGGVAWVSSILSAQLGRTGLEQGLRGATDWAVQKLGPKVAAWLVNTTRSGSSIYGAAAMNHLSKVLRGNLVTGLATTLVLSSVDVFRLFKGRMSGAQLFKNVTTTALGVAGGTGGWMGGASVGGWLGSMVMPGPGTAVGAFIGGVLGSLAGGVGGSTVASATLDSFIEDDANEMLAIVQSQFEELADDYLLSEAEAGGVLELFKVKDVPDTLREMYASDDRKKFAREMLEPLVEQTVKDRSKVVLPTADQLAEGTRQMLEELIDEAAANESAVRSGDEAA